jgi:hypothetical protein
MSAYPSLLSPLMDATGKIAAQSINDATITAISSGVSANEKVDILQVTALQESGGNYLGLPSTNITARGTVISQVTRGTAFSSPGFTVSSSGSITSNSVSTLVSTGVYGNIVGGSITATHDIVAPIFRNNSDTFLTDSLGNCKVNELTYTTLNPPISAGWVGTATSDLNMSDYGIVNTPSINFINGVQDGVLSLLADAATLDFDGLNIQNIGSIGCGSVTTGILNIVVNSVQVASLSDSGLGVAGGVVADGGVSGLTVTSSLTTGGGAIANYDNSFSVHSNGNITCPLINAVAPQFKPTYDYYVAKNGSDSGLGSVLSPFLTVQHAIGICETVYDEIPRVIHLASGTFSENLVFSKSRISIVGGGTSMNPDVGSSIAGTITINLASGNSDMNNNNIYFDGLLINGEIQDNTNSYVHRLFFTNCYLYANSRCLLMNVTGDYRLFVDRCYISNSSTSATNALVQCLGTGMISITNSKLTSKGLEQMTCVISVSCRTDTFANNILTSDSTSTTAPAILWLGTSATVSIGNCAFIYSSSAVKSNATAAGIRLTSSGSLVIVQSFFSLAGLSVQQNAIQNGGMGVVIHGNNISASSPAGTSAFAISGTNNQTKFSMTSVQ